MVWWNYPVYWQPYINPIAAAILCLAFPDKVPFMADEAVRAVPELSSATLDYSLTQYMAYAKHLQEKAKELNDDSGEMVCKFSNNHSSGCCCFWHLSPKNNIQEQSY